MEYNDHLHAKKSSKQFQMPGYRDTVNKIKRGKRTINTGNVGSISNSI
jgi:hypothetical protein